MANRLQIRRGTAAAATSTNPLLAEGEWGVETDTGKVKMGDGVTLWNALDYISVNGISIEWLGSFATAPGSPTTNQAYYNTTDGKSYVWDGSAWNIMAQDGGPIPVGGVTNDILAKTSAVDGEVGWTDTPILESVTLGNYRLEHNVTDDTLDIIYTGP